MIFLKLFSKNFLKDICKCLPGYELINNSCKLCSDDQDFSVKFVKENNQRLLTDHKEEILNKIEILNKNKYNNDDTYNKICGDYKNQCYMENLQAKCRKTCMVGSCFIPGAQSSCFVNGCFGRGICTPRGVCISCFLGSTGTFCQILNWNFNSKCKNKNK